MNVRNDLILMHTVLLIVRRIISELEDTHIYIYICFVYIYFVLSSNKIYKIYNITN